jgi:hypothetical protein
LRRTIVCLANSYKHGGRCIAGISLKDGRWVRLRGATADGALDAQEYLLDDGSHAEVLDLIEVELDSARPSVCHPEDWQIAPLQWRLLQRPLSAGYWAKLQSYREKGMAILGSCRDRIATGEIRRKPMQSSLALVCPAEIHWWIRDDHGKRKYRALFRRNSVTYELPLTDPVWIERLSNLPVGIYPHAKFAPEDCETWLTVSLSEEFHGWHYKLVAAVIVATSGQSRGPSPGA